LNEQDKLPKEAPWTLATQFDSKALEQGAKVLWKMIASNHAKKVTVQLLDSFVAFFNSGN